ncbi:MAG: fibrillarin-like rRNA/tRNA 2'-O-methyltransferase [Thaumarchaeota archaeon]|nr:fibrillarin-like rRNA/tRNA 2'-O-methyltransferase [Candidatus Calditenuaceae archaeon]MDW8187543.1 fibrillarin-like rRNA/tRNA 2'-O-methyltransferase [Nitrososphaerota archaeon]
MVIEVEPHEVAENVYWTWDGVKRYLCTKNLDRGFSVYGEQLFRYQGEEYREWVPYRSKLAAALIKGMRAVPISPGTRTLYLGAASGTTVSHVSDITGERGAVYAVEYSPRVLAQFVERVAKRRRNVVPVLGDARLPERYAYLIGRVDVIYCDVAQPDQARIVVDNARTFLRSGGKVMVAIKARSIDSTEDPERVFRREIEVLERGGAVLEQRIDLEPYELDHVLVTARFAGG